MNKLLLFTVFMFCAYAGMAQQKNFAYCELVGTEKLLSTKVKVQADFGQQASFWKGVDYLRNASGKVVNFNSMVDAMNYMGSQGWEFVQAYVVTTNNQNVYHWLLKKEINQEETKQMVDGFNEAK